MNLCTRRSLGLLALLSFATVSAFATDATLTADAHVNSAHPTTNYGSVSNLYVGGTYTGLIQFDLTSLPSGTTAAQISKATLRLYANRVLTSGTITVSSLTSAWQESQVTYATAPTIGAAITTFSVTTPQYVTIDITAQVQSWITTPSSNNGLALTSTGAAILFDTKENDETAHASRIDVTITSQGAIGPQGVQGPQGIQGVAGPAGAQGIQGAIGPQGIQGVAGAIGPTGAAGTGINYRNAWNGATIYQVNDAVTYNGSSYVATVPNVGVPPTSTTPVTWTIFAAAGSTGAVGAQGIQGPQGIQGLQGIQGNQGIQGAIGPAGATGTVSYQGVYSTTTTYTQSQIVSDSNHYNTYISLTNSNLNNPLPTSGGITAFWATLAAQGAQGIQGPAGTGNGTVTSVAVGTITNSATQGNGSASVTNGTSTPTLNINFPTYTLPTELSTLNSYYTSGINGTGVGIFLGPANGGQTCTLGDTILSTQSYYGGAYLPADGRQLQISSNTAIFSLMGTNFGGNGTTNFNLPNLSTIAPPGMYYSICVSGVFPSRF